MLKRITCDHCHRAKDEKETVVVFRHFKEGDIVALFPELPSDVNGFYCECYAHIGQHGGADTGLVYSTKPANEADEDVQALIRELTGCPYHYRLRILRRIPRTSYAKRQAALRVQYNAVAKNGGEHHHE
jgi:hypothetical protein